MSADEISIQKASVSHARPPPSPYKAKISVDGKPPPIPGRLSIETSKLIAFVSEQYRDALTTGRDRKSLLSTKSPYSARRPVSARDASLNANDMGWSHSRTGSSKKTVRPQSARLHKPERRKPRKVMLSKSDARKKEQGWNPSIPVNERRIPEALKATQRKPGKLQAISKPPQKPAQLPGPADQSNQTFTFKPVQGSDPKRELEVLRYILIREGLLNRLHNCSRAILRGEEAVLRAADGSGLLDLLLQIRAASVEVVEAVIGWRKQAAKPAPFLYNGRNYLIKMKSDMDFLGSIAALVEALGVEPTAMVSNPLMMPRNLNEAFDAYTDAGDSREANHYYQDIPETEEPNLTDQQRLARAEIILAVEEEEFGPEEVVAPAARKLLPLKGIANTESGEEDQQSSPVGRAGLLPSLDIVKSTPRKTTAKEALLRSPLVPKGDRRRKRKEKKSPSKTESDTESQKEEDITRARGATDSVPVEIDSSLDAAGHKSSTVRSKNHVKSTIDSQKHQAKSSSPKKQDAANKSTTAGKKNGIKSQAAKGALTKLQISELQSQGDEKQICAVTADQWTNLASLTNPPQIVALVCATALILTSPGELVPKDISWPAVKKVLGNQSIFLDLLSHFDDASIAQFKLRAIRPFIGNASFRPSALQDTPAASALCAWILAKVTSQERYREWLATSTAISTSTATVSLSQSSPGSNSRQKDHTSSTGRGKTPSTGRRTQKSASEKEAKSAASDNKSKAPGGELIFSDNTTLRQEGETWFVTMLGQSKVLLVKAYNPLTSKEIKLSLSSTELRSLLGPRVLDCFNANVGWKPFCEKLMTMVSLHRDTSSNEVTSLEVRYKISSATTPSSSAPVPKISNPALSTSDNVAVEQPEKKPVNAIEKVKPKSSQETRKSDSPAGTATNPSKKIQTVTSIELDIQNKTLDPTLAREVAHRLSIQVVESGVKSAVDEVKASPGRKLSPTSLSSPSSGVAASDHMQGLEQRGTKEQEPSNLAITTATAILQTPAKSIGGLAPAEVAKETKSPNEADDVVSKTAAAAKAKQELLNNKKEDSDLRKASTQAVEDISGMGSLDGDDILMPAVEEYDEFDDIDEGEEEEAAGESPAMSQAEVAASIARVLSRTENTARAAQHEAQPETKPEEDSSEIYDDDFDASKPRMSSMNMTPEAGDNDAIRLKTPLYISEAAAKVSVDCIQTASRNVTVLKVENRNTITKDEVLEGKAPKELGAVEIESRLTSNTESEQSPSGQAEIEQDPGKQSLKSESEVPNSSPNPMASSNTSIKAESTLLDNQSSSLQPTATANVEDTQPADEDGYEDDFDS